MNPQTPKLSSLFKLEYPQSVGVYHTYDEAQRVVDYLADARFPVENLCIVGTELRSLERVLGRRSWGTVVGAGVQSGLSTGLMITLFMWLLMPAANFALTAIYALVIGMLVGIAFSALGYWMSQGKRDFTSVSQTMATKYEVLTEHKVATQARELLATMPGVRAAQFNPPPAAYQPGYPPAPGYPPGGYGQPGYPQQPPYPQPPAGYGQQPFASPGYPQPQPGQPGEPASGLPYPQAPSPTEPPRSGQGPDQPGA